MVLSSKLRDDLILLHSVRQLKLLNDSYPGIAWMILMTFSASAVCRVQSKDPRLLSLMVLVVLEVDVNWANAFSKPLRNSAGSTLALKTFTTPFAMFATSKTPSQNSMMSPVFSADARENPKISFLFFHLRNSDLLEEVLVRDISAIFRDPEDQEPLLRDLIIDSFAVDAELFAASIPEDLQSLSLRYPDSPMCERDFIKCSPYGNKAFEIKEDAVKVSHV